MISTLLLLAIIGSFIGWVTNKLAIKMLFKPVNPTKILFFEIQGVFPKRQKEIAKSLGKVVENELVGLADIKENLMTDENINRLKEKLKEKFNKIIEENIPPVFLSMAGEQINLITEKFISEDNEFFKELFEEFMSSENSVNIKKIVEEKINKMDFSMFEKILLELISKELSFIEYLGAILGFVIGIIQGIIILFIK